MNYIDTFMSFDIETSSFYHESEKYAYTYAYTIDYQNTTYMFRYVQEFMSFLSDLPKIHNLNPETNRLVIYVHNLSYEFQFIKHLFTWHDIFANGKKRNVIRAVTDTGLEFRCSYALTNKPLKMLGEEVGLLKKMGDLDYSQIRNSITPLTDLEIGYNVTDVKIITLYINSVLKKFNDTLGTIPMTSTGYVRRDVRKKTVLGQKNNKVRRQIQNLKLKPFELKALINAYQGGYTHGNNTAIAKIYKNVVGYDIGSSYPSSLVKYKFPMSNGRYYQPTKEELERDMKHGCILINLSLKEITAKTGFSLLSKSKCVTKGYTVTDNGRLAYAEELTTTITDVDYRMLKHSYDIEQIKINYAFYYKAEYLPTSLVDTILYYYENKTTLKGNEEQEDLYMLSKQYVNGIYGMMVTNPIRPQYEVVDNKLVELPLTEESFNESLEQYNNSKKRFTFYPWGVWTTAYSRLELFKFHYMSHAKNILNIYTDTDSLYSPDSPELTHIANALNEQNSKVYREVEKFHNFPKFRTAPKNEKGERYQLGLWEYDGKYTTFKTLGAKRYAGYKQTKGGDKFSITISGVPKKTAEYIDQQGGLDFFTDGMHLPADHSGRTLVTYVEKSFKGKLTDYLGNTQTIETLSSIHIENNSYNMTLSDEFKSFIKNNKKQYENMTL